MWVCRRVSSSRYKICRLSRGQKRLNPTQDEVFTLFLKCFVNKGTHKCGAFTGVKFEFPRTPGHMSVYTPRPGLFAHRGHGYDNRGASGPHCGYSAAALHRHVNHTGYGVSATSLVADL